MADDLHNLYGLVVDGEFIPADLIRYPFATPPGCDAVAVVRADEVDALRRRAESAEAALRDVLAICNEADLPVAAVLAQRIDTAACAAASQLPTQQEARAELRGGD